MTIDISPAPGRTPVPLERGWTAVFLAPIPGAPVVVVGLFLAGELELLVEEPAEVAHLARVLAGGHASPIVAPVRPPRAAHQ